MTTTDLSATDMTPPSPIAPAARPTSHYPRPPGLLTPRHLWILYLVGCAGLGVDALLASPVVGRMFNLHPAGTNLIVFAVGILAAVATTEAATAYVRQQKVATVLLMGCVFAVGVGIAALRHVAGVSGAAAFDPSQFGAQTAPGNTDTHDGEWAAIMLILALYFAAATGIFVAATKIFIPERAALARHDKDRRQHLAMLGPLEAQNTAIHERLAYWPRHRRVMEANLRHAQEAADAREAQLKAYARDAIAQAVGRADATALVRAPHEPGQDED